jgi:hypothetical protein
MCILCLSVLVGGRGREGERERERERERHILLDYRQEQESTQRTRYAIQFLTDSLVLMAVQKFEEDKRG